MIDWWNVAGHAVWIFGAAVLLARFSYRRYEVAETRTGDRAPSRPAIPDRYYRFGLLLLSAGLSITGTSWVERVIWGVLSVTSIVELIMARPRRSSGAPQADEQA